jgi:hypothetical protein
MAIDRVLFWAGLVLFGFILGFYLGEAGYLNEVGAWALILSGLAGAVLLKRSKWV